MQNKIKISSSQLFCLLFLSRIITGLTYSPQMVGSEGVWDNIISELFSFLITFVIILPIYFLNKKERELSIVDVAFKINNNYGKAIAVYYIIYFILVGIKTLFNFNLLITNVLNPLIDNQLMMLVIVLISMYAVLKGIEGLVRVSTIILFIMMCIVFFIFITLAMQIDPINYLPVMLDGPSNAINGLNYLVANSSELAAIGFLAVFVNGNIKKGIIFYNTASYVVSTLTIIIVVGAMGSFIKTQFFPIYSASSLAEVGILRRLDSIYLSVFTMGIVAKVSLFLLLFNLTCKKLWGSIYQKRYILIGGFLLFMSNLAVSNFELKFVYNTGLFLILTILAVVVIPMILLFYLKKQKRGKTYER